MMIMRLKKVLIEIKLHIVANFEIKNTAIQ